MKRFLFFMTFVLCTLQGNCDRYIRDGVVEIDGIAYWFTDDEVAEVTHHSPTWGKVYHWYKGDVIIPSTVTMGMRSYPVVAISDHAFMGCTALTSVTIPNSVKIIRDCAFYGCSNLTSIIIPESVKIIGAGAFSLAGLSSITIPNSVVSIGGSAFVDCDELISANINVTTIPDRTFQWCQKLKSLTIGESVCSIGTAAFYGCTNLKDVYCYSVDVPALMTDCFREVPLTDATLHVPSESLEAYRNAEQWRYFFGFIIALTDEELDLVNITPDNVAPEIVAVYDINGCRQPNMQKGLNIVKYSNGNIKKVLK